MQGSDRIANRTDTSIIDGEKELVELIDWCRYVVHREPSSVNCTMYQQANSIDYQHMSLHFDSTDDTPAVMAQISCGDYIPREWSEAVNFRPPAAMQICCQRGVAFIDLPSTVTWFDDAGRHMESLESEAPVGELLLTHFHRAVTSLVRDLGDLNDAYQASSILLAARESASSGGTVSL